MSESLTCPWCGTHISAPEDGGWWSLPRTAQCPHCGKPYQADYDEIYDDTTGDEWGWFELVRVET